MRGCRRGCWGFMGGWWGWGYCDDSHSNSGVVSDLERNIGLRVRLLDTLGKMRKNTG